MIAVPGSQIPVKFPALWRLIQWHVGAQRLLNHGKQPQQIHGVWQVGPKGHLFSCLVDAGYFYQSRAARSWLRQDPSHTSPPFSWRKIPQRLISIEFVHVHDRDPRLLRVAGTGRVSARRSHHSYHGAPAHQIGGISPGSLLISMMTRAATSAAIKISSISFLDIRVFVTSLAYELGRSLLKQATGRFFNGGAAAANASSRFLRPVGDLPVRRAKL